MSILTILRHTKLTQVISKVEIQIQDLVNISYAIVVCKWLYL